MSECPNPTCCVPPNRPHHINFCTQHDNKKEYEVIYYKKILCIGRVRAKTKDDAKEYIYQQVKAEERDGLHQFTVKRVTEMESK